MKTFGKYQVIDEIGKGPAGITYRALDTARSREIALKVLEGAVLNPNDLTACGALLHPQIAAVADFGEQDGAAYVATELFSGQSIKSYAALPPVQKLKLMAQVCEGLTYAHRSLIAHGNLKPSNIFVTADQTPKILDFGIARWARPASPNYLAPEQILDQSFDARSDVFSAAVIVYELLTGVYPFQAAPGLIPREIVHTEPLGLRKLDPKLPEELERLIARALQKDPQARLQSAEQLAAGLQEAARTMAAAEIPVAPPAPIKVETPAPPPPPPEKKEEKAAPAPPPGLVAAVPAPKRWTATIVGAVLGVAALGIFLSRQSSSATPAKAGEKSTPAAHLVTREAEVRKVAVETSEPDARATRILRNQVSTLWENGRYTQAMKLVDEILAGDPNQPEARTWKKKIRAAQDAEEALK